MAEDLLLKKVREFLSTKEPGTVVDALDIAKAMPACITSRTHPVQNQCHLSGYKWFAMFTLLCIVSLHPLQLEDG
eukprot:753729-Amphidinium_carterae.1